MYERLIEPMMPKIFNLNEIFILVAAIIFIGLYIKLPDKLNVLAALFIYAFSIAHAGWFDFMLAVEPFDLYDTMDRNGGEFSDVILQNILYPLTLYFFIYIYERYDLFKRYKYKYIFLFGFFIAAIDFIGERFIGIYDYKGWTIYYSYIFYVLTCGVLLFLYNEYKNMIKRTTGSGKE